MGVYGCIKFAQKNGLVKSQIAFIDHGTYVPVAVDLWNVVYGLMQKFYARRMLHEGDDCYLTIKCLFLLFRLMRRKSFYPIFVFDGDINGEMKTVVGAKAIVAEISKSSTPSPTIGSGRVYSAYKSAERQNTQKRHEICSDWTTDDEYDVFEAVDYLHYSPTVYQMQRRPQWTGACQSDTSRFRNDARNFSTCNNVGTYDQTTATNLPKTTFQWQCCEFTRNGEQGCSTSGTNLTSDELQSTCWNANRCSCKSDIPRIVHKLCIDLIRCLGYAYIEAGDVEADDVCANLYHTKTVLYVISSDTDLLLMGCDIIIDITPTFPLIIRCGDILKHLNVDYPTFLTWFVRCHTDLHKEPTLMSMQEVVEMMEECRNALNPTCFKEVNSIKEMSTIGTSKSIPPLNRQDDEFVTTALQGTKRKSRSMTIQTDHGSHSIITTEPAENKNGTLRDKHNMISDQNFTCLSQLANTDNDESDSWYNYHDIKIVDRTLQMMTPPKTLCEVMERKYIKHVLSITTPEIRTSRISILKRVPITQELRCDTAVKDVILKYAGRNVCEQTFQMALRSAPQVPPYSKVLGKYKGTQEKTLPGVK